MKYFTFFITGLIIILTSSFHQACDNNRLPDTTAASGNKIPAELQGSWMYGNFSMKEYWKENPSTYIGNAFQFAIAFRFNSNGTYEQYFTSSSVTAGLVTYQQSVTKGTAEIDTLAKTIKTLPLSAHYKRTRNGKTEEDRYLAKKELSPASVYYYKTGVEPNGTKAVYLKLGGTGEPLTFLKK